MYVKTTFSAGNGSMLAPIQMLNTIGLSQGHALSNKARSIKSFEVGKNINIGYYKTC